MELLTEITKYSVHLSQEPNGNYVLQKVLALEDPVITKDICNKMKDLVAQLSTQKHSSYVIEMCLQSTWMEIVVLALLKLNPKQVSLLAQDQFGNYVLQKALTLTKYNRNDLYQRLVTLLMQEKLILSLQHHPNGRNVYNLLDEGMLLSKNVI
ncbi:hypothetical protein AQUCO_02800246v1 [Aquilegia coerulea]|uniref:PUM-HD domain-containing protein n=1 Tax=Aquilegia coerulea TaxID=218851 RepID=A0A2G5D4H0_AQUCA|nr:hypothetical protein AQUCO_02800246v1 [Aquilegia coerulea]